MAAAVKVARMDHTAAGLRDLVVASRNSPQSQRLLALAIILEGRSSEEATRQAGMDRQTLRDWVLRYNELGADGLVLRAAPGLTTKLSDAQMQALRARSVPLANGSAGCA